MKLTRIQIENFRNFRKIDVAVDGNIVIVGENSVGKSNLLYALRLIFDPNLPDSARQLGQADFWDGLGEPLEDEKIVISAEVRDFEEDLKVLASLTDWRRDDDPHTVRLTYEFRPVAGLDGHPLTSDDYEFVCYGGESDDKRLTHELRRRIAMDLLPALRDAEGDLGTWRRSPLRPLLERAFANVPASDMADVRDKIEEATEELAAFDSVQQLEDQLRKLFLSMSGPMQDIQLGLGFGTTDVTRLYRNIRLLIDGGLRTIGEASLGSANVAFLALKALELRQLMSENRRSHTLLAIEEPEAHLHPHLQRSVYRHLFEDLGGEESAQPLSLLLTTHSPHIASVAPLRSLVLLRESDDVSTVATSAAGIALSDSEEKDLARYLDVTRAEMLFARGIILVEGDAEKFLLPVFAASMGHDLDYLGITVCSVAGTNFTPYSKFLTAMGIPFSILTDWDPFEDVEKLPLGFNRSWRLVQVIEEARTGKKAGALISGLKKLKDDYSKFSDKCEEHGIFSNASTLEVAIFKYKKMTAAVIATLREEKLSDERAGWVDAWEANPTTLHVKSFLALIEDVGKGRFAQRLATRVVGITPPTYIASAIQYVVGRV